MLAAPLALAVPLGALAAAGSFTTNPQQLPGVGGNAQIRIGDWIAVGFSIQNKNGNAGSATLYLENAAASLRLTCSPGSQSTAGTLSIPLAQGPWTVTGGQWSPTDHQNDPSTYQLAAFQFSTALSPCNGGAAYVTSGGAGGETYAATLASSNDLTDQFHIQLHTAIPDAANKGNYNCSTTPASTAGNPCDFGWNGSQDNLTAASYSAPSPSPTPAPTPNPTPTPTPAPTPSPSPSPSPTPSPSPGSSPGSTGGSSGGDNGGGGGTSSGGDNGGSGGSSGGSAGGAAIFYPSTVLGAHTSRAPLSSSGGTAPSRSGASPSLVLPSAAAPAARSGLVPVPVTAPPPVERAPLLPVSVVSPAVADASLITRLPLQWWAFIAAIDCVLVLLIIARRNRARESAMKSRATQ